MLYFNYSYQLLAIIFLSSVICSVDKLVHSDVKAADEAMKSKYYKLEVDGSSDHDVVNFALLRKFPNHIDEYSKRSIKFESSHRYAIAFDLMMGNYSTTEKIHYLAIAIEERNFRTAVLIANFIILNNDFKIDEISKILNGIKFKGKSLYDLLAEKYNTGFETKYYEILVPLLCKCGLTKNPSVDYPNFTGEAKKKLFDTPPLSTLSREEAFLKDSDFEKFVSKLKLAIKKMFDKTLKVKSSKFSNEYYDLNFKGCLFKRSIVSNYLFAHDPKLVVFPDPRPVEILHVAFLLNREVAFATYLDEFTEKDFTPSDVEVLVNAKLSGFFAEKFVEKFKELPLEIKDNVLCYKAINANVPDNSVNTVNTESKSKFKGIYVLFALASIIVIALIIGMIFFFKKDKTKSLEIE